ncbi:hypothetical protein JX266_012638 [Neoarthrinium moseri]|nr:hypothetical protein JX266_012638 [Neoarthrinium moseri]
MQDLRESSPKSTDSAEGPWEEHPRSKTLEEPESDEHDFLRGPMYYEMEGTNFEDTEQYKPGGLHPIHLGDILGGRFEVITKLGQGGFSTVWLCFDTQNHAWRAVKILASRFSNENAPDLKIVELLEKSGAQSADWEMAHIQLPKEHFWLQGPNGRHLCLVLPLLGRPIKCRKELGLSGAALDIVKDLLLQVAKSLQFLHQSNIVHGDLRPDNILLQLEDTGKISKEEMIQIIGTPSVEEVGRRIDELPGPYAPEYLVEPADLSSLPHKNEVAIVDFGISFHVDNPPKCVGIPSTYASPEASLGHPPGIGTDLWAYACTILDMRRSLTFFGGLYIWEYLQNLERILGPLPEPFRTCCRTRWENDAIFRQQKPRLFDGTDSSIQVDGIEPLLFDSLEKLQYSRDYEAKDSQYSEPLMVHIGKDKGRHVIAETEDGDLDFSNSVWVPDTIDREEVIILADLARKVFRYAPEQRIGIDEIMQHEWFKFNDAQLNDSDSEDIAVNKFPMPEQEKISDEYEDTPLRADVGGFGAALGSVASDDPDNQEAFPSSRYAADIELAPTIASLDEIFSYDKGTETEETSAADRESIYHFITTEERERDAADNRPRFEDVEEYREGGFHPIRPNDVLGNRFEVIAKLGHGRFGTVWLCTNTEKIIWRAIKVLAARYSMEGTADIRIREWLEDAGAQPTDWEASHLQLPREHFWIEGINGRHLALVLPLFGPRLSTIRTAEPATIKKLLLQASLGLQFLHHHGVGHGDFRADNLLLHLEDTSSLSMDQMQDLLGLLNTEDVRRLDGAPPGPRAPAFLVEPVDLSKLPVKNEIAIVGFELSYHAKQPRKYLDIPFKIAAPEAILGCYPGLSSDVWALICTFGDMLADTLTFEDFASYVLSLEVALGPLPHPYRRECLKKWRTDVDLQSAWRHLCREDETLPEGEVRPLSCSYRQLVQYKENFAEESGYIDSFAAKISEGEVADRLSRDEVLMFANLCSKVLRYDPDERLTIDGVIRHDLFRGIDIHNTLRVRPSPVENRSIVEQSINEVEGPHSEKVPAIKATSTSTSGHQVQRGIRGSKGTLHAKETGQSLTPDPKSADDLPAVQPTNMIKLLFIGFAASTAMCALLAALFFFAARAHETSAAQNACAPGFVYAQTRKLTDQTTFFEGAVTFPGQETLDDGTQCPVFRDLNIDSEVKIFKG